MVKRKQIAQVGSQTDPYLGFIAGIAELLEESRRTSARAVNSVLTATYWEVGRRIVEFEQGGETRAKYGAEVLNRLSKDLTQQFGRGFSRPGLQRMRSFFDGWEICSTVSSKLEARVRLPSDLLETGRKLQTVSAISELWQTLPAKSEIPPAVSAKPEIAQSTPAQFESSLLTAFPLSWSHYVRLMSVAKPLARAFYEAEAIRGGWSVRQLDRQIGTQFFERTSSSKQQAAMLTRGQRSKPEDLVLPDEEIRDPYLLEFLNLKDEYSEGELEDALIEHLEAFLLELGAGFTFVARQKRIRIGTEWYRIDLLLYHRRLRCLVVLDLKIGKYTHADAGQMSLYLTYAKEHLMEAGENEPVGIILCSDKDDAVVHYSIGSINARVFASKYMTELPDVETLQREIESTKRVLIHRQETKDTKRKNSAKKKR